MHLSPSPFLALSPSLRLSVFRPRLSVPLSLLLSVLCPSASAQEGRSRPIGYLDQAIPTGQTRSFSVPFDPESSSLPQTVGRLTAVGTNYLDNSAAAWTPGAFSTAAAPYFARITSGAHAGRMFRIVAPANTATRLHVADDGVGLATLGLETSASGGTGATFEIIPGDTLATFFGTTAVGDTLVVHGAGDPIGADLVQVWGGAAWLNFYYNTVWQRWARDTDQITDPSRNNFLLRSDRGLMLTRRGPTPLEITVGGRVLATSQRAAHGRTANALTFLATMQTGDITLSALGLQNGTRTTGWVGSADPATADLLIVWSGSSWFSFYYNTATGQWQRVGDPANRDGYVIAAGTPVFVQRNQAGSSAADQTIVFPAPGT